MMLCISQVLVVIYSFISDIIYLSPLFFALMSLPQGLFTLFIFSKNQLLVSFIFYIDFKALFHFILL